MIRIVFVTHYSDLYGANRSLINLMDGLGSRVRPHVVLPRVGDLTRELDRQSTSWSVVPFWPWVTFVGGSRILRPIRQASIVAHRKLAQTLNRTAVSEIAEIARSSSADLIYTNTSVTSVGLDAAEVAAIPHIWHLREFGESDYDLTFDTGFESAVTRIGQSTEVIANSAAVLKHYFGSKPARATAIPNGVISSEDLDKLARESTSDRADDSGFTFALVGYLHPKKGQHEAIDALAIVRKRFPNTRLVLAGSGKDAPLRRQVSRLGLNDAVEFTGYVANPFEVYLRSHAALMCSEREAAGRVTAEAMAAGIPVIGRASGGTPELIEHEKTGLLFEGNVELAQAMTRLVENPAWAALLGAAARQKAAAEFTIETYAERVFNVIERTMRFGTAAT